MVARRSSHFQSREIVGVGEVGRRERSRTTHAAEHALSAAARSAALRVEVAMLAMIVLGGLLVVVQLMKLLMDLLFRLVRTQIRVQRLAKPMLER